MDDEDYKVRMSRLESMIHLSQLKTVEFANQLKVLNSEKVSLEKSVKHSKSKKGEICWEEKTFEWTDQLHALLKEKFKFNDFRFKQLAAINATLSKQNVLLVMPTGGGKSLVYQLSALIDERLTLVISPFVCILEDQLIALKNLGIEAFAMNSASTREERWSILLEISSELSGVKLLFVTPEWIVKSKLFINYVQKCFENGNLSRIVIDEVHCCSLWSHHFKPDYNYLGSFISLFPSVPILGLTATATLNVLVDIQKILKLEDAITFTAPFNRPNLFYKVWIKPDDTDACIKMIIKWIQANYKDKSGIIYTSTVREAEILCDILKRAGFRVRFFHEHMDTRDKKVVYYHWSQNKYQIVVATVAFGFGVDKPDVRFVIHFNLPKSLNNLYQETGRAGRDGAPAECLLLFNLADYSKLASVASSQFDKENLQAILKYSIDKSRCRRDIILNYLGDGWRKFNCDKKCDNCKDPKVLRHYAITPALNDILTIIEAARVKCEKLTLKKLTANWFQHFSYDLRLADVEIPKCSKEQSQEIIAHLISEGYLQIEKGFTMHSTVPYIQKGNISCVNQEVIMSYEGDLEYTQILFDLADEEPSNKKARLEASCAGGSTVDGSGAGGSGTGGSGAGGSEAGAFGAGGSGSQF